MSSPPTRSLLALTDAAHRAIGSTPPHQALLDNPGKTLVEALGPEKFREYFLDQVQAVREQHRLALTGDKYEKRILQHILKGITADIEYLREIGCLPAELSDLDPLKEFALPE